MRQKVGRTRKKVPENLYRKLRVHYIFYILYTTQSDPKSHKKKKMKKKLRVSNCDKNYIIHVHKFPGNHFSSLLLCVYTYIYTISLNTCTKEPQKKILPKPKQLNHISYLYFS